VVGFIEIVPKTGSLVRVIDDAAAKPRQSGIAARGSFARHDEEAAVGRSDPSIQYGRVPQFASSHRSRLTHARPEAQQTRGHRAGRQRTVQLHHKADRESWVTLVTIHHIGYAHRTVLPERCEMDTKEITIKTMQAIRKFGSGRRHFMSRDIRIELDYAEDAPETHYMHNVIQRLKKQGILVATGDRKRNQYLEIAQEGELRRRIAKYQPIAATGASRGGGGLGASPSKADSAPRRVLYLEERMAEFETAVRDLRGALENVREGQDHIRRQVDELIALWN
jgi:hypothetical protein